jgi:hypothetical protein
MANEPLPISFSGSGFLRNMVSQTQIAGIYLKRATKTDGFKISTPNGFPKSSK